MFTLFFLINLVIFVKNKALIVYQLFKLSEQKQCIQHSQILLLNIKRVVAPLHRPHHLVDLRHDVPALGNFPFTPTLSPHARPQARRPRRF